MDRLTQIASGSNPHFDPFVSTCLDHGCADVAASLAEWAALRGQLLDFVAGLSERQLRFTGTHDTLGEVTTIDLLTELSARDDRQFRHIYQLIEDYWEEVCGV